MAENFYATLGVEQDASDEEIAKEYRELARQFHPDLNPDDTDAEGRFKEIQRAFEVLGDPEKRAEYDDTIRPLRRWKYDPNIEKVHINPPPPCRRWRADPCTVDLVLWPAVCLLLVGLLSIPGRWWLYGKVDEQAAQAAKQSGNYKSLDLLDRWLPVISSVSVLIDLTVLIGAINMLTLRVYPFAVIASILVMTPCFGPFCGLGCPFGAWALVTLCDSDVRDAFWSP